MEQARDIEDVVLALGYLTLGSRFKRIGEQLQAGSQAILAELDSGVPVAQFPMLAALDRLGPLTVGEMAAAIGITQPGATRSLAQLAQLGLVDLASARSDRRVRVASLTPAGRDLVARSRAGAWANVEAAVANLCAGLEGPLLQQLADIEQRLAKEPLAERVE